jgi:hypothetical protein
MSELQKQLDETVRLSMFEGIMTVADLTGLSVILAEAAIYFNHTPPGINGWDYVVGGLVFVGTILGLSGASNHAIQMNRYDNQCFEIGEQVKAKSQLASSNARS